MTLWGHPCGAKRREDPEFSGSINQTPEKPGSSRPDGRKDDGCAGGDGAFLMASESRNDAAFTEPPRSLPRHHARNRGMRLRKALKGRFVT
jgi:hypothetical protein